MGKAKKTKPSQIGQKVPLDQQIEETKFAKSKNRNKIRVRKDDDEQQFVDPSLSRKILSTAREQLRELNNDTDDGTPKTPKQIRLPKLDDNDNSDSDNDDEDADLQRAKFENETFYENIQINEDDEKAIERFMSSNPKPRRMLADIIMEKLTEKQTELNTQFSENNDVLQLEEIDPKVKQMYESVGNILKQYRSGKIPKCFKIIPTLRNWEQMLYLTNPNNWSAAAMYQATRIFTSNLKENLCQRFFYLVLLPRIRDDLLEYKRLNFHLYQALRKALYKPKAFMKGILLPLCESGNCTLREAIIVGSVIAKNSIPVLPSSAAILKIAEMDYNGANSIFLRIFFDKKYALPYRVIDGVVFHFLRFRFDTRQLPVLWHQALLTFVQRYKSDISSEQKENLLELLKKHEHYQITPEIRRELQNSKCRDVETATPQMDFD